MSLTLQFYNTKDNPKKINKTITAVGAAISLDPFEDFDLENPYVILDNGTSVGNYATIGNDYFFAEVPILMTGRRKMVRFTKDVLMSNKDQLMNVEVIAARSSNLYNSYMNDPVQALQSNYEVQNYQFYEIGDSVVGCYGHGRLVLVTIGGKTT